MNTKADLKSMHEKFMNRPVRVTRGKKSATGNELILIEFKNRKFRAGYNIIYVQASDLSVFGCWLGNGHQLPGKGHLLRRKELRLPPP